MKKMESGRSMIEMLGVLAIIGVLSIGGIAGYTMAMRRYRANNILDAVNKYSLEVYAQCQQQLLREGTAIASCTVSQYDEDVFGELEDVSNADTLTAEISETSGVATVSSTLTFASADAKLAKTVASVLGETATEKDGVYSVTVDIKHR